MTLHFSPTVGFVLFKLGKFDQAKALLEPGLQRQLEVHGTDLMETLAFMPILASIHAREGRSAKAEHLARTSFDARARLFGPNHPETIKAAHVLHNAYVLSGKSELAADLLSEIERRSGDTRPDGPIPSSACNAEPQSSLAIDPERPAIL